MSARQQGPEGPAHQDEAPNKTGIDQSFMAGVGLTGSVLATAVLGFVLALGAASFEIWPAGSEQPAGPAVELNIADEGGAAAISDFAGADGLTSGGLLASTGPLPTGAPGGPRPGGGTPKVTGDMVGSGPGTTPDQTPSPGSGSGDDGGPGEAGGDSGNGGETDGDNPRPPVVTPPPVAKPPPVNTTPPRERGRGHGGGRHIEDDDGDRGSSGSSQSSRGSSQSSQQGNQSSQQGNAKKPPK